MTVSGTEFVIEEVDSPDGLDPIVVALAGRDAPVGGRGSGGAFEIAPETRTAEFYYPGQDTPTRHVQGIKYAPLTIKGNLQDRYARAGHARAVAEQMELVVRRKRALRLAWGSWVYRGLSDKLQLSPETLGDINYEWTFHIDGPDERTGVTVAGPPPASPPDLGRVGVAQRAIVSDKTNEAADLLDAASAAILTEVALAVVTAIDALTAAFEALSGTVVYSDTDLARVLDLAGSVMLTAGRLATITGALPVPGAGRAEDAAAWSGARAEILEAAWALEAEAFATGARLEAQLRGAPEEVYVARDGDTLESVARERLGDEGRAGDIARMNGLAGFRLAAGQRLLIPARA